MGRSPEDLPQTTHCSIRFSRAQPREEDQGCELSEFREEPSKTGTAVKVGFASDRILESAVSRHMKSSFSYCLTL